MKKCSSCKVEKPISEFNNSNGSKDGKQYMCITCSSAYIKGWVAHRSLLQPVVNGSSKTCYDCKSEKPLSQFGKKATTKDKLNIYCKECWNIRCKASQRKYHQQRLANAKK